MKKIDENYILLGLIWLLAGMAFGMYLGATNQLNFANSHAHANLVGFVASTLFGLIYRFFPAMKSSKLAMPQFWIYEIGAVLLVAGKIVIDDGGSDGLVKFGSVVVSAGAVLMLVVFVRDRQPKSA